MLHMPRMPARVFAAVLVAEDGRRTAAELADQLGVSPAAISGAVPILPGDDRPGRSAARVGGVAG
jgi:hypothetical protein